MSNANTPMGLKPVFNADGTPWNGATRRFYVSASDSSAIGIGDPVKLDTTNSQKDPTGKYPTCILGTSGAVLCGVVTAVKLVTSASTVYREASTLRYVDVCVDPGAIFEAQEDSDTSNIAYTNVGHNCELVFAAPNTTTGISNVMLDSDSAAATQAHDVRIISLVDRPDNALGQYAKWLVQLNHHQYADNTFGIGA